MGEGLYNLICPSHRLKLKAFRIASDRAGDTYALASDFVIDDRFQFAFGGLDRLGIAEDCESWTNLPKLNAFLANVQIQFYVCRKCSV